MKWMKSSTFFKVINHLIEDILSKRNCSFLICQNGQVIRNIYKKKNEQVNRNRGSSKYNECTIMESYKKKDIF